MHTSSRVWVLAAMVLMATVISGCIISVSPDPDKLIIMEPGDQQTFRVISKGTLLVPVVTNTWYVDGQYMREEMMTTSEFVYTPQGEDVGVHTIKLKHEVEWFQSDLRTWTVEVHGVCFTPNYAFGAVRPGESTTFTAKVCPEGQYAYTWYKDGVAVGNDTTYTLTPTQDMLNKEFTLSVQAEGQNGTYTYQQRIFIPFAELSNAQVMQTSDGGYITTSGSPIIKLDAQGSLVWQSDLRCRSIRPTSDAGYLVLGITTDGKTASLTKLDAQGSIQWQQQFVADGYEDFQIELAADGGCFLAIANDSTGYLMDTAVKLDSEGNIQWQKEIGKQANDWYFQQICPLSDGGFIVVGSVNLDANDYNNLDSCVSKYNADGDLEWEHTYGGTYGEDVIKSVKETPDGGYVLAGSYWWNSHNTDIYLIKLSSTGTPEWERRYAGRSGAVEGTNAIQPTTDGGWILNGFSYVGFYEGNMEIPGWTPTDVWLLKFDAAFNVQWSKFYGGNGSDKLNALIQTEDEGFIGVGWSGSTDLLGATNHSRPYDDYATDGYFLRLDPNGAIVSQKLIGGSDYTGGSDDEELYAIYPLTEGGFVALMRSPEGMTVFIKLDANGDWQ